MDRRSMLLVGFATTLIVVASSTHQRRQNDYSRVIGGEEEGVRLVGGYAPFEGRLEVFNPSRSAWGTVVHFAVGRKAAEIVCRQLGLTGGKAMHEFDFGPVDVPQALNWLGCQGNETTLLDCPEAVWEETHEGHFMDVGVQCCGPESVAWYCLGDTPFEGAVELSGGWGPYDGLLFIYHIGEWGNVSERGFNDTDATVVCRSLGYSGGQARGNRWYGEGMGVIWMSGVQCTGEESSLADCEHNGWRCHYCNHRGDVATRCV